MNRRVVMLYLRIPLVQSISAKIYMSTDVIGGTKCMECLMDMGV